MAQEITLSREWKQSLTTSKMKPFAMQVSLWDLLFFTNASGQQCVRYINKPTESNWRCKGFELPHNIIVLDEKMYLKPPRIEDRTGKRIIKKATTTNTIEEIEENNLTTFDKWSAFGFDISLPWFDVRTKPLFLKRNNYEKYVNADIMGFNDVLNGLQPEKLSSTDFYYIASDQQAGYAAGFKVWDKDAALKPKTSYDFYLRSVLKPSTKLDANTWEDYPDPWYVATEDDHDDKWVDSESDKNPGTIGADIILCNKDTSFEKRFIIPDSGFSAYNAICLNWTSKRVWKNFLKYYSATDLNFDPLGLIKFNGEFTLQSINPILNYLLKHCYVWLKCAFYADYVDYRDFNQSLNEKSQVIHNNMILGKGNYKRYEELYSEGGISPIDLAKNTRPYFPTTTPIKDKLKESLLTYDEYSGNKTQLELIENIISNSAAPESKIGSLLTEPFEDSGDPSNPPKSPNFTTGVIREEPPPIWFDTESRKAASDYSDIPILMGKDGNLITSGRLLSPTIDELWHTIKEMIAGKKSDSSDNSTDDFGGYPKNINSNSTIPLDTRLKIPNHKFKNQNGTEKIGDPTEINIETEGNNLIYRVKSWVNNPDRIIYNVIAELQSVSNDICGVGPNLENIVNRIESLPKPNEYLPMATIPSLRELEGILKGLRWNLAYYIKFMFYNAVYIGSNGKSNTDNTAFNKSSGTTYLLHKNKKANTETVYDERINRNIAVPYGEGLGKITGDMFGNNTQDIIPPWTVFMSAAGTWQSVSQAINIRIRDDEIW
jgi:hypothetical protein